MASSKKSVSPKTKKSDTELVEASVEDAVVEKDENTSEPIEIVSVEETTPEDTTPVEEQEAQTVESEAPDAPENTQAAVAPTPEPEKSSVFLPLVLGGIIAGGLGFMASEYDVFGNADADITTKLRGDLNAQQERIAALEQVEAPTVDLSPIEDQLSEIETRIAALEERPAVVVPEGVDGDAVAAYAAELSALKEAAAAQRSEIEALIANAKSVEEATADAARTANGQAAIAKIVSALDAGQPFADAVATLQGLDLGDIDPALINPSAEGVATLSTLQSDFPDQARAALAAARAAGTEEGQQGIGGFLTRSLGVRSVAPREGDDPDAVLSRAEAAIKSGDLATTLTELDTLPEDAQAVIADWRAAADARVEARAAADALAQRLTAD